MSRVTITDASGSRTLDMEPVESYIAELERKMGPSPGVAPSEQLQRVRAMCKEQLEHLVFQLTSLATYNAWLYAQSFKPSFFEQVEKLRTLRRAAEACGVDLWPELGEGTR
jgi:hypothetical protein